MGFLKPKAAKSSSENTNNALITGNYSPTMKQGNGATNFLSQLLGVSPMGVSSAANSIGTAANGVAAAGGAEGGYNADDAYKAYLDRAGYAPAMRELARGVTGQGAASGLLRSGATAGRLQTRGAELNNGYFNNFMQQLAGLSGLGLQAGNLVSGAGQKSTSTGGGPSTLGSIASTVGSIASIFSDRRTKREIVKIDEFDDGLGLYTFRYIGDDELRVGVMADEVEAIRPWALGPTLGGYQTVNYAAL